MEAKPDLILKELQDLKLQDLKLRVGGLKSSKRKL